MRYLLALALFLSSLVSLSIQIGPSNTPNCFVCPPTDLAGRPLIDWNDAESQLFCRFQTVPNDFFCKYFTSNGLLKQDHDDGFCPPVAIPSVCTRRKRSVPRSPEPPQPVARNLPDIMKGRAYLGNQKRQEEENA